LNKNLKNLTFYNCNNRTIKQLAYINFSREKSIVSTDDIKYQKNKLTTKKNYVLGHIKEDLSNFRIILNIKFRILINQI